MYQSSILLSIYAVHIFLQFSVIEMIVIVSKCILSHISVVFIGGKACTLFVSSCPNQYFI